KKRLLFITIFQSHKNEIEKIQPDNTRRYRTLRHAHSSIYFLFFGNAITGDVFFPVAWLLVFIILVCCTFQYIAIKMLKYPNY
ncbi:hypothetical protein, partial [Bacteroides caecimuris]|uniref:hypothetical protein n=1 Tax=Bacteroides caecimuris TaxID=1796613 RepID=UPI00257125E3